MGVLFLPGLFIHGLLLAAFIHGYVAAFEGDREFFYYGGLTVVFFLFHVFLLFRYPLRWVSLRHLWHRYPLELAVGGLLMIFGAILRFSDYHLPVLDKDEGYQASFALYGARNFVSGAAVDLQPPLDYSLTALGVKIFGPTEKGMRFFPALLGSLSVPLLFGMVLLSCGHLWPAVASAFLLATHGHLIYYAQEGRPLSTGVFFAVYYLYAFQVYFRFRGPWVILLMANLCFFLSVGFQPVVAAGVFTLSWWFLRKLPGNSRGARGLLFSLIGSGLLVSPFLKLVWTFSQSRPHLQLGLAQKVRDLPAGLSWEQLERPWGFLGDLKIVYFLFLIFFGFWGFFLWSKSRTISRSRTGSDLFEIWPALPVFLTTLLFPPIFYLFFYLLMPLSMLSRYYLTFSPFLFWGFGLGVMGVMGILKVLKKREVSVSLLISPFLIFSLFHFASGGFFRGELQDYLTRPDWKALYRHFLERGSKGGMAYLLNFGGMEEADWFPLTDFYYPEAGEVGPPVRVVRRGDFSQDQIDHLRHDLNEMEEGPLPPVFYFVARKEPGYWNFSPDQEEILKKTFPGLEIFRFHRLTLFSLPRRQEAPGGLLKKFYEKVWSFCTDPSDSRFAPVLLNLLVLEWWEDNRSRAFSYWQKLVILDQGKLNYVINKSHELLKTKPRRAASTVFSETRLTPRNPED